MYSYDIVRVLFLCYCKGIRRVIYLSLSNYIKNHKELSKYDFATVYFIIIELLKDGKMEWKPDNV
jgi:hypothetical protein